MISNKNSSHQFQEKAAEQFKGIPGQFWSLEKEYQECIVVLDLQYRRW
jgi:hypothetical protein